MSWSGRKSGKTDEFGSRWTAGGAESAVSGNSPVTDASSKYGINYQSPYTANPSTSRILSSRSCDSREQRIGGSSNCDNFGEQQNDRLCSVLSSDVETDAEPASELTQRTGRFWERRPLCSTFCDTANGKDDVAKPLPEWSSSDASTSLVQQCTEQNQSPDYSPVNLTENDEVLNLGRRSDSRSTSHDCWASPSPNRTLHSHDADTVSSLQVKQLQEHTKILQDANRNQAKTICELRRRIQQLESGESLEELNMNKALLQAQIELYKEDFENERRDKERALSEKESLLQQTTTLLNELRMLRDKNSQLERRLQMTSSSGEHNSSNSSGAESRERLYWKNLTQD